MKTVKEKQIVVGADFAGYPLKEAVCEHLRKKGWEITDIGVKANSDPEDTDLMFHRVGLRAGAMISEGEFERALLFCGTGIGISMAANKIKGIRAACCSDYFSAQYTRLHNDANALCMGGRVVGAGLACELVDVFLATEFEGGRHQRRVDKLSALEQEYLQEPYRRAAETYI